MQNSQKCFWKKILEKVKSIENMEKDAKSKYEIMYKHTHNFGKLRVCFETKMSISSTSRASTY